jgi:thiol-disulfide isomerase/thioredoxin
MQSETKRYLIVFIITAIVFVLAFWMSSIFSNNKIDQLREIQEQIAIDILSTETRYSLLEKTSCVHSVSNLEEEQGLSRELNDLARRLKFMESQLGEDDEDVLFVKKYYSLLQVKDFLLMEELSKRCGENLFTILYFHQGECDDCQKQSLVLDELVEEYPETRVYWFDKDVNTPAVQTMLSIFGIKQGPTMVINDQTFEGFYTFEEIQAIAPNAFPEKTLEESTLSLEEAEDGGESE